jgi:hypothetical protein
VVPDLNTCFKAYLGTESISTVYAAELKRIQIALAMVKRAVQAGARRWRGRAASQAGLKALIIPLMVSGQLFLKACLELEGWCREAGFHVVFRWIPAHVGIDGNEKANELTKTAAVRGPMPEEAKQMVQLGAAAKRMVGELAKENWVQAWKKEKPNCPTKRLVNVPGPQVVRYWKGQQKATSSVLIQLRTGYIGLNQYLTHINIHQDARCGCGLGNQNPQYIVMKYSLLGELCTDI